MLDNISILNRKEQSKNWRRGKGDECWRIVTGWRNVAKAKHGLAKCKVVKHGLAKCKAVKKKLSL